MTEGSQAPPGGGWVRRGAGGIIRVAHRGASGLAPENTHAAFAAALETGVDAIELDCQLSADGELVVIHDETLDRTTDGHGPVGDRTWAELARLDAGAWRGERFRGERIPRLAGVLAQVRGRARLNVEIKSARDLGMVEPRLATLVGAGDADRVLFSSFHPAALRRLRAEAPWAALGVLWDRGSAEDALALAGEVGACCLVPGWPLVDRALVEAARGRGLGVWAWTVNAAEEMRRLAALGVDALFSDYPERFADLAPR
jgi:glycerophosphoryl diester phosphodiesterase